MQFKHYLICLSVLLLGLPNSKLKAACNWKSKGLTFQVFDSCNSKLNQNVIYGRINYSGCYKYKWTVNGSAVSGTNGMTKSITTNGNYTVCVTVTDSCNKCDTTYCTSIKVSCIPTCQWSGKNLSIYAADSCWGSNNAFIYANTSFTGSCYRYYWTIGGVNAGGSLSTWVVQSIRANGTYDVCLTIKDTCNYPYCDTTICTTVTISCLKNCNWSGKNIDIGTYDSCVNNNSTVYAYINSKSIDSCLLYYWSIDGIKLGSSTFVSSRVTFNGTHDVCLSVKDTCTGCDTFFCTTINTNCLQQCDWSRRNLSITIKDSCLSDGTTAWVSASVARPDSCLIYDLRIPNMIDSNTNSVTALLKGPWTYDICMKVTDTCNGCDTFICMLYKPNCPVSCDWSNKDLSINITDSCINDTAWVYAEANGRDTCLDYKMSVAGISVQNSGSNFISGFVQGGGSRTYDICMKVTDMCNGCDTTICVEYKPSCSKTCDWSNKDLSINITDSCFNDTAWVYAEANGRDTCLDYKMSMTGMSVQNSGRNFISGIVQARDTWTYDICMKVTDMCTGCDTTVCVLYKPGCGTLNTQKRNMKNILLFPNPAQTYVEIKGLQGAGQYYITDVSGRLIMQGKLSETQTRISLIEMSKGIYNISIMQGTQSTNHRLILE